MLEEAAHNHKITTTITLDNKVIIQETKAPPLQDPTVFHLTEEKVVADLTAAAEIAVVDTAVAEVLDHQEEVDDN